MSTWMTGKNSIKHHNQRKEIFTVTEDIEDISWKIFLVQITHIQEEFEKILKQKI